MSGQLFGGQEALSGVRQVGVGFAHAREQSPQGGDDDVHVDPDEGREQVLLRAGGVEDDDAPACFQHAVLFLQGLVHVDDVAHQKARNDRVEGGVFEGQAQRICGGKIQRADGLRADAHHLVGEVGGGHFEARHLGDGLARQVACARAEVQQARFRIQPGEFDHLPAPADILKARHQAVHQVIAAGDPGEHVLNVRSAFVTSQLGHGSPRKNSPNYKGLW